MGKSWLVNNMIQQRGFYSKLVKNLVYPAILIYNDTIICHVG